MASQVLQKFWSLLLCAAHLHPWGRRMLALLSGRPDWMGWQQLSFRLEDLINCFAIRILYLPVFLKYLQFKISRYKSYHQFSATANPEYLFFNEIRRSSSQIGHTYISFSKCAQIISVGRTIHMEQKTQDLSADVLFNYQVRGAVATSLTVSSRLFLSSLFSSRLCVVNYSLTCYPSRFILTDVSQCTLIHPYTMFSFVEHAPFRAHMVSSLSTWPVFMYSVMSVTLRT